MNFPSAEFDDAVASLCDGRITDEKLAALHELLGADTDARDEYLWRVELHGELATNDLGFVAEEPIDADLAAAEAVKSPIPLVALFIAAALVIVASLWMNFGSQSTKSIGAITQLTDAQWMSPEFEIARGDDVVDGQRLELQSGTVELLFNSGARMELRGPAIVIPSAANRARLIMGEVHLVAETPESKGFALATPTCDFIDIGTAFTAAVAPDGLTHLDVAEGEVDVVLAKNKRTPRFREGESMYLEPGKRQVMTRIESGEGTEDFIFPTIPPPSSADYADQRNGQASIRVTRGYLRERPRDGSGTPEVLLDGRGQSKPDSPNESAFFDDDDGVTGRFMMDLGSIVSIQSVNAYSWHQHEQIAEHRHRARQFYTLYGFEGELAPNPDQALEEAGWIRIARVNSDGFFNVASDLDRPSQQATSISAASGNLGRYRYLLWEVTSPTFFCEFDVFATPTK